MMANGFCGEWFAESAFVVRAQVEQIPVDVHCFYLLEAAPLKVISDDFETALIVADGFWLAVGVQHLERKPNIIAKAHEIGFRFDGGRGDNRNRDRRRSGEGCFPQTSFPEFRFHLCLFASLCGC